LLDDAGAVSAAVVFTLMSLSPSVLGLAAKATHFVVLCALGAILVLFRACEPVNKSAPVQAAAPAETGPRAARIRWQLFTSGTLFGLGVLMKQHGILFAVFGIAYIIWLRPDRCQDTKGNKSESRRSRSVANRRNRLLLIAKDLGIFALGCAMPYLLMCIILAAAGVFHEFWFWTFTYARKYVSAVSMAGGPAYLRRTMGGIFADNPYFWVILALGCVVMWWDDRLNNRTRGLLTVFALCSCAAVSAGFYFREHYFILLLPATI